MRKSKDPTIIQDKLEAQNQGGQFDINEDSEFDENIKDRDEQDTEESEERGLEMEIDDSDLMTNRLLLDGQYKLFIIYPETRFKVVFDVIITV